METAPHRERIGEPARRLFVRNFVERNQRVRVGGQRRRVLEPELPVQFRVFALVVVPLLARDLAGAAADAVRDVDEGGLDRRLRRRGARRAHALLPFLPEGRGAASRTFTTLTRHALVSCVPAPGSTASMVRWLTLTPLERPAYPQLY